MSNYNFALPESEPTTNTLSVWGWILLVVSIIWIIVFVFIFVYYLVRLAQRSRNSSYSSVKNIPLSLYPGA
jgi:flagellar biogenesis protein FliO